MGIRLGAVNEARRHGGKGRKMTCPSVRPSDTSVWPALNHLNIYSTNINMNINQQIFVCVKLTPDTILGDSTVKQTEKSLVSWSWHCNRADRTLKEQIMLEENWNRIMGVAGLHFWWVEGAELQRKGYRSKDLDKVEAPSRELGAKYKGRETEARSPVGVRHAMSQGEVGMTWERSYRVSRLWWEPEMDSKRDWEDTGRIWTLYLVYCK